MTIYKHLQRDPVTFWQRLRGLFGDNCVSYIRFPDGRLYDCELRSGHKEKHQAHKDANNLVHWGYGDEYLGISR